MRPAESLISVHTCMLHFYKCIFIRAAHLLHMHKCTAGTHSKLFNYVPQHKETCFESIETLITAAGFSFAR